MKKVLEIFYGLLGLVIITGIGYFIFRVSKTLISNIDKINANFFVAILGATVTITGYFLTRYFERSKIIEIEIRNKKTPIYEEFMAFYFKNIFNSKTDNENNQQELIKFFQGFHQKAIVWFPDEVLQSYIAWKENIAQFSDGKIQLHEAIFHQEEFMRIIRKDIGHKNKGIDKWKISSLYINDIDIVVKQAEEAEKEVKI